LPSRESVQYFVECDASFDAGQRVAQAVVRPDAKRQMLARWAGDVELLGIGPNRWSSRLAAPINVNIALPAGTVWP